MTMTSKTITNMGKRGGYETPDAVIAEIQQASCLCGSLDFELPDTTETEGSWDD